MDANDDANNNPDEQEISEVLVKALAKLEILEYKQAAMLANYNKLDLKFKKERNRRLEMEL